MSSLLPQSEDLTDLLKRAAQRVEFGAVNAEPTSDRDLLPQAQLSKPNPRRQARTGILASVAVHLLLIVVFSLMAGAVRDQLGFIVEREAIRASLSDRDILDEEAWVPRGATVILDQSSGPAAKRTTIPASIVEITLEGPSQSIPPEDVAPAVGEEGEQETGVGSGGEEGFRYQKPKGGQAVTKGSFTVWTEPSDPFPNQPYLIVVQMRVPEKLISFPKSDLKIEVAGTDSFYLKLPDPQRGFQLVGELPVIGGQTQLVIPIPGAPYLVRDAIRIESRTILKEKQSLLIEF